MKVNFAKEIVQAYMSQSHFYRRRQFDVATKKTMYHFRIKASFTFFTTSLFFDFDIAFNCTSSQRGFPRKLSLLNCRNIMVFLSVIYWAFPI